MKDRLKAFLLCLLTLLVLAPAAFCQKKNEFKISSSAFTAGGAIPRQFTGDGKDVSPPLSWSGVPQGTRSLALTCEDPDAPAGTWFHWIIFNIPPGTARLKEGIAPSPTLAEGITHGRNDFEKLGYNGPAPPRGTVHHYHFKLVALDGKLDLKPGCSKKAYYAAIKGHILASTEVVGTYQR